MVSRNNKETGLFARMMLAAVTALLFSLLAGAVLAAAYTLSQDFTTISAQELPEHVVDQVHSDDGTVEGMPHQRPSRFSVQHPPDRHPAPDDNLLPSDRSVGMLG